MTNWGVVGRGAAATLEANAFAEVVKSAEFFLATLKAARERPREDMV